MRDGAPNQQDAQAPSRTSSFPRICLAASGGGHLRQLLDLAPVWSKHDHFFLTEDTALSRSLERDHRTYFITHVALGQARLGRTGAMVAGALRNFGESARAMLRERPQLIITTGAGAIYFGVLWARLLGARVVLIESFARFDRPSKFARIAAPLAHHKVVQAKALAPFMPDAAVFDPLRLLEGPRPPKKPLLFATVGATLPFDKLVKAVAELKASGAIPEEVLIQTGIGGLSPPGVETVETLPFDQMQARLREADIVVCHGGTGSLITALREGCRVIVMPRLASQGEHYDNHQEDITKAFAARGLVSIATNKEELAAALETVRQHEPIAATTDPKALIGHLEQIIAGMEPR